MDIIGHLARTVTPAVLGDNHNPQNESLLKQFYALFAAKLADNDSYNRLGTQEINREDLGLFDRLWTDEGQKTEIANELAAHNNVDVISVKGLLASAAPLALQHAKVYSDQEYLSHIQHQVALVKEQFRRLSRNTNKDLRDFAQSQTETVAQLFTAVGGKADAHAHH